LFSYLNILVAEGLLFFNLKLFMEKNLHFKSG